MCSIAGITNENPTDVTLMLKTMRHRALMISEFTMKKHKSWNGQTKHN